MKKNLFAILMLIGIMFSASCTKDDVEEPTLQLSETATITLPKAASEKAITVTTNQSEWTAITNVNWIELTQSGATLTIKAGENFTSAMRKAEVMVLAGGLGRKLAIEQTESELTIVTIPDKLEINQWGGIFQFDVNTNTDDWNVTSDAEWVKVTPKQFKKEVMIEVEENTEREERTAILTISREGNTSVKEFTVTQSGIMYYILPFLQTETTLAEITEFETARKSTYIPDFNSIFGEYTFATKSAAFPSIVYIVGTSLSEVAMTASSNEFITDPEFEAMMSDNGFEKKSENTFTKEETQGESKYAIEARIIAGNPSGVIFEFVPLQPGPMPTFDEMPYGFVDFGAPDGSVANVQAWEADNGGTYNTESSSPEEGFYWFDATAPWIIRAYIFENQPFLLQTMNFFPDIEKFFYEVSGEYQLTTEFKALMDKEGFTDYLGASTSGLQFYGSADNPLEMALKVSRYTDVLDGTPVVELRFHKAEGADGESLKVRPHFKRDKTTKQLPRTLMRTAK